MNAEQQPAHQFFEDMGVASQPAGKLAEEFESESALVEFLTDVGDLMEIPGVGDRSAQHVRTWFEAEYPDKERERKDRDEAICTEFTTDHGLQESQCEEDVFYFAFICPREACEHVNPLKGDPDGFQNRPYRCVECNWVSLLDADALDRFKEEVDA